MSAPENIVTAVARPWGEARAGKCYTNVQDMIRQMGGQMCYGWALTDFGPHRSCGSQNPPPLYRRWLNHVVWRDPSGQFWEVTPNSVIGSPTELQFRDTEFVPDARAVFEIRPDGEWFTRHTQYVAVRPEGAHVTELLTQAQHSIDAAARHDLLRAAALQFAGFRPREWKIETIGQRTGSIWLIAE